MESALLTRGFHYGSAPNSVVIGWNGGHAAVTLPDGTPVSSGESNYGVRVGGGGAYQPQFSHHMYLPVAAQEMNDPAAAPATPPAEAGAVELASAAAPPAADALAPAVAPAPADAPGVPAEAAVPAEAPAPAEAPVPAEAPAPAEASVPAEAPAAVGELPPAGPAAPQPA